MRTQIIILAAGHGKRMQSELPKALTPLAGKPFIAHVLQAVADSGVCANPIIVIGQKGDQVKATLGDTYRYAVQTEQLGTGHAVMSAEGSLVEAPEHILILYADQPLLSAETIKKLEDTHIKEDALLTMATTTVPDFESWRMGFASFGRVVRGDDGSIVKIVEAKDANPEELALKEVNPAYMCYKSAWLWEHLHALRNENAQKEYYLTDLIGMAFAEHQKIVTVSIDPKEALGVNTKEQLEVLESLI